MVELMGKSNNHGFPLYGVCVCVVDGASCGGNTGLSAWFTDEGRWTSRQFSKEKSAPQT